MNRRNFLIIVVFLLVISFVFIYFRYGSVRTSADCNTTKRVFILLGQSNMQGYGKWLEYPDEMRIKRDDILIMGNNGWEPLVPNIKNQNGPEISFAHKIKDVFPNNIIAIIKVATGGAGIRAFIPDWKREIAEVSEDVHHGSLYKKLKRQIDYVKKDPDIVFCGVLWKQGGKDMIKKEYATGYLKYLKDIITQIRKDTGVSNLPLFIATYYDIEIAENLYNHSDYYKDREAALDIIKAHNMAAIEIDNTYVIHHGNLPVLNDGVHFTTESLIKLGYLFAQEVEGHCNNK